VAAPSGAARPRLFGTDGVRGRANDDLTPELALRLGSAAVRELTAHRVADGRPRVAVGRDPRPSGELLQSAVAAGLASAGADVTLLGVVPTAVVAHAAANGAALGVMITASHNPLPDNGLKFFAAGGWKLADDVEDAIERRLDESGWQRPTGAAVGRVHGDDGGTVAAYLDHLLHSAPHRLDGLRVVVDCAHGAAGELAPRVYRALGADVVALHTGDGEINAGVGATHPHVLQEAVLTHRADAGIAHDGDADRCLAVDAEGRLVDGDQILAICALARRDAGTLKGDAVVSTVMANLGFHHALRDAGIGVVTTPVGDRYVLEAMLGEGLVLGGEQSGHIVFLDEATTGDGLLTALHVLGRVAASGRPLADLAGIVHRLPQVLEGVQVDQPRPVADSELVRAAVRGAEDALGDRGRVLVRASGTEPLVRIMVEAPTEGEARAVADDLSVAVRAAAAGADLT
jgi:phosphoglucosamine mutase